MLEIYIEGPTLEDFCANEAIDLWVGECPINRKPHQSTRNSYKPLMKKGTDDDDDSDTDELIELDIDKWDAWFYED